MRKAIINYIEEELYDYESSVKKIKEMERDIIDISGISYSFSSSSGEITSDTEQKALALVCNNKELLRLKTVVDAIERAKKRLDEIDNELLNYRYNKGIYWRKIIDNNLPMSERTYRRRKNRIIETVGTEMGFSN